MQQENKQQATHEVKKQYGPISVTWSLETVQRNDKKATQLSTVPPSGVRVFYPEDPRTPSTKRVVVYVHDKVNHRVFFQTCVYKKNDKPVPGSVPFCKTTHRRRALERLMNCPMVMIITPDQYVRFNGDWNRYIETYGDFTWDKHTLNKQDINTKFPQFFDWQILEKLIVEKLETPPQNYYKNTLAL